MTLLLILANICLVTFILGYFLKITEGVLDLISFLIIWTLIGFDIYLLYSLIEEVYKLL